MNELLWEIWDVRVRGAKAPRLEIPSLVIYEGVTAVLGSSGAGKTSLLNLLVGYEKPDEGGIVGAYLRALHRVPLYWVPQSGGLWPHLTVKEHLAAVAAGPKADESVAELLEGFDISAKANSYPDELSMGEKSRVSIARALAANPIVMVMDEPLAHVDLTRAARYWETILDHVDRNRTSLIFATHSPKMVVGSAELIVCLKDGRVFYRGPVEELYWRPATREQAECLGEVNWFEPGQSRLWFGDGQSAKCYRPEQVQLTRAEGGPLIVKSARFMGEVAEAELEHEGTGEVRKFFHRPPVDGLQMGDRVILKVLAMLLMALLIGCGAQEPPLHVARLRVWPMPPNGTTIPGPRSVAFCANGEVVALDMVGRVLVFDGSGTLKRQWRMPETSVGRPEGVCELKDGRIAIADTHYSRVVLFDKDGGNVTTFGRNGTGHGEFIYPVGITQDNKQFIYVCEYGGNDRVQKFTPDGEFVLAFGSFGTADNQFQRPSGLAWRDGKVYVADAINNRIQVFSDDGRFVGRLGMPGKPLSLSFPYGVAVGPDNALYVIEYSAGRITKIGIDGQLLGRYGTTGTELGQFQTPWGLAIGPGNKVLIADTGNRRIMELQL